MEYSGLKELSQDLTPEQAEDAWLLLLDILGQCKDRPNNTVVVDRGWLFDKVRGIAERGLTPKF